jgi:Na+/H+ antiporter NhaA
VTSAAPYELNTYGVTRLLLYLLLGILLWGSMLFSGIHATLAGVVLAMMIPTDDDEHSLLHSMERVLSFWVAFGVLPIFGFAKCRCFDCLERSHLVPVAARPRHRCWPLSRQAGGDRRLGVPHGFTMSLFIGLLAFSDTKREAVTSGLFAIGAGRCSDPADGLSRSAAAS